MMPHISHSLCLRGGAIVLATCCLAQSGGNLVLPPATIDAGSTLYQAQNSITNESTFVIDSAASITFAAGSSVTLVPGFQATAGTANPTFHALIKPGLTTTGITPTAPPASTPVKEYIRLNGQVIAIENH